MVSETGPDPDEQPELFALFRSAWNASKNAAPGQLERQSLRAAAPQFADRMEQEETDPEPQPGDGPDYHADHAAWLARNPMSEVGDTFPVPEGVCGQRPYDWRLTKALDSGSCVFLPNHEGKHSWQK